MPVQAAVLAASDETVEQLASLLAHAGHTVVSRAVVADKEAALATKLETWIAESVELVIGVSSDEMRGALVPLITKRLLGFSDLNDVDGGRCKSTIVVLLPPARITQELIDKVSSRVATEVARKPNA